MATAASVAIGMAAPGSTPAPAAMAAETPVKTKRKVRTSSASTARTHPASGAASPWSSHESTSLATSFDMVGLMMDPETFFLAPVLGREEETRRWMRMRKGEVKVQGSIVGPREKRTKKCTEIF
uniref:Tip4b n=1 Tax=Arundo donax TaxID=35708 RepID=A0A0A9GEE3_ARUDO